MYRSRPFYNQRNPTPKRCPPSPAPTLSSEVETRADLQKFIDTWRAHIGTFAETGMSEKGEAIASTTTTTVTTTTESETEGETEGEIEKQGDESGGEEEDEKVEEGSLGSRARDSLDLNSRRTVTGASMEVKREEGRKGWKKGLKKRAGRCFCFHT